MDYHAIHGHDISSFDLPSTHRLPTVSAAKALQDLQGNEGNCISTGLPSLDASLRSGLDESSHGGIQQGHVTEVWGPPGAGKTAFGIQLAASCLGEGRGVVWVDGFHRLPIQRLRAVVGTGTRDGQDAPVDRLDPFTHYTCPSLPHFIALLCRPTASCIPQGASLIVVDSLSALVNHAFPKMPETRAAADAKGSKGPSIAARRLQVLQYMINSLQKLAATRDLAIVILTQCATKMQAERGATLIPAINATVWEQGVSTRLVLFRDWFQRGVETRGLRFAGVQKLNGKTMAASFDHVCAFKVEERGLSSVDCDTQQSRTSSPTPARARKRKLGITDFEIADSDEEYGWDDDGDAPPMPSQWQGSEDILLVRQPDSDQEDQDNEDAVDLLDGQDQGPGDAGEPPSDASGS
ncbi:P-loop containing nucleoside triphosphate hydrolase protein [Trichocladium antarcticum]|uniref:P-loop containing nucleoside triphosphate hydrolase protein n=1 Tax=Trichocladium antarcticum TaxID=1450529 RepID=A0AAN6UCK8_9PEZI|nr:P-loop containing nucleoside triphosphate hydrolase protein [Trichocladium antarcticum]